MFALEFKSLRTFIHNLRCGARWALPFIGCLFIAECAALAFDSWGLGFGPTILLASMLIAAAFMGAICLGLAAFLGLAAAYVGGTRQIDEILQQRSSAVSAYMRSSDTEIRRKFAARFFASILWLTAAFGISVFPVEWLVVTVQTPFYGALLSVAAVMGCVLVSALMWPIWFKTGSLIVSILKIRLSPRLTLTIALAIALAIAVLSVILTWDIVGFAVPWRAPALLIGWAAILIAWFTLKKRIPKRHLISGILKTVCILLFIAGIVTVRFLPVSMAGTNVVLEQATGPVSNAHQLTSRIFDWDADGSLHFLGQGDCAPHDPLVHPEARDLPNDGIDQDCSGVDRIFSVTVNNGRFDYPSNPPAAHMPLILVTIDTVGSPHLDLYGYERKTMPRLTAHAKSGAVFNWAFSEGPSTRLTFPSLMTGKYCSEVKRRISKRSTAAWHGSNRTIAHVLLKAGYETEAIAPNIYFSKRIRWLYSGFQKTDTSAIEHKFSHCTGAHVTDAALARIDHLASKNRFFLWVHYTDAHATNMKYALPEGIEPFPGGRRTDYYDRSLQILDEHVDRLLVGIKDRMGDTPHVVLLTADHGESFDWKHKKKGHHGWDLSTSVTHVPMIVWSPYSEGRTIDRLTSTLNIAPTFFNMVGIKKADVSGDRMLPSIQGAPDSNRPIMQQMFFPEHIAKGKEPLRRVSVRLKDHVLHKIDSRMSLYNFKDDPGEKKDLIAINPGLAGDMKDLMADMLEKARPPEPDKKRGVGNRLQHSVKLRTKAP